MCDPFYFLKAGSNFFAEFLGTRFYVLPSPHLNAIHNKKKKKRQKMYWIKPVSKWEQYKGRLLFLEGPRSQRVWRMSADVINTNEMRTERLFASIMLGVCLGLEKFTGERQEEVGGKCPAVIWWCEFIFSSLESVHWIPEITDDHVALWVIDHGPGSWWRCASLFWSIRKCPGLLSSNRFFGTFYVTQQVL